MTEHDPIDPAAATSDYWRMMADASDLTIEGHRLIAQEIAFEVKRAWRGMVTGLTEAGAMLTRHHRNAPPA